MCKSKHLQINAEFRLKYIWPTYTNILMTFQVFMCMIYYEISIRLPEESCYYWTRF